MTAVETLAVVLFQGKDAVAQQSVAAAAARGLVPRGRIGRVEVIKIADSGAPAIDRNTGIDRALELGASWIFFVDPDEVPHEQALTYLSAMTEAYDGLWGGLEVRGSPGDVRDLPKSQMSSSETVRHFHMALHWWIGKSHFVRSQLADKIRFDPKAGDAWYADYLLRLWEVASSLKTAQPITWCDQEQPGLSEADRQSLLDNLQSNPRYASFHYQTHDIHLAYTGRNPTLERVQMRGLFYEQPDLECLSNYLKPGAVCVDVGANTGNHTVFFAKVLAASKVIPIEPNPETVSILKQVIAKNGLANADPSRLGLGVGRQAGRYEIKTGRRGFLGTAQLEPNPNGAIHSQPLDEIITEDVDLLKVDVERMEIEVLEGAKKLIARCRPTLFIEAQDENILSLLAILENLRYRIVKVFPDQGYANYVALPEDESLSRS